MVIAVCISAGKMKNISTSAPLFNNEKADNEHSNARPDDRDPLSRVLACEIDILCWHYEVKLFIVSLSKGRNAFQWLNAAAGALAVDRINLRRASNKWSQIAQIVIIISDVETQMAMHSSNIPTIG